MLTQVHVAYIGTGTDRSVLVYEHSQAMSLFLKVNT